MASRSAIGLDIGTTVVRAAEVSFGRSGIALERFGQVVLPEGAVRDAEVVDHDAVVEALKILWKGSGFTHKNVVLGVGNQRVLARSMDIPWLSDKEMKASLGYQVADVLPMPLDSAVLDFFTLDEFTTDSGSRMRRGLLVAAHRQTVMAAVNAAEAAGLIPTSVDLTSFALLRAVGRSSGLEVDTEAIIEVGARVTNIIVHSAGVPQFVRMLLKGGQDITDAVSEAMGVTADEAEAMKQRMSMYGASEGYDALRAAITSQSDEIAEEIRGSLNYFAQMNPGMRVERVLITGGGSLLEGLRERLAGTLRVTIASGDPLSMMHIGNTGLDDRQLEQIRPLASVPVGLALGAIR